MKKHNIGRTLVELLLVGVVALTLGLGMFGYKPVHSNAGTLPAGTECDVCMLINPIIQGGTFSSATASNVPSTIVMRDSNGNINAGVITPWTIIAASGTSTLGAAEAINTSSAPITRYLPASSPNATVTFLDAYGTFNTNNVTISAPSGVPITAAGIGTVTSPAAVIMNTRWIKMICTYLNSTIGYRCFQ